MIFVALYLLKAIKDIGFEDDESSEKDNSLSGDEDEIGMQLTFASILFLRLGSVLHCRLPFAFTYGKYLLNSLR